MIPSMAGVLLVIAYMGYTFITAIKVRNHSMVGGGFLLHARNVFREHNQSKEVTMLNDVAIPHLYEIRLKLSGHVFWMIPCFVTAGASFWSSSTQTDSLAIILFGLAGMIYSIHTALRTQTLKNEIDEVCEACNDDLVDLGFPDEYQNMLNKYMDDAPTNG